MFVDGHVEARLPGTIQIAIEIAAEEPDMVQAESTHAQKIQKRRRRIVSLLDKRDLHVSRITQCNAGPYVTCHLAVAEVMDRSTFRIVEGADMQHFRPVLHRGFDVPHDVPHLANGSEKYAHGPASAPWSSSPGNSRSGQA